VSGEDVVPTENFLESLYDCIVFSARDWALDDRDAWIYGIVVGWEGEALAEVARNHSWDELDIKRLQRLHASAKEVYSPKK
jgi:hypothetical protein